MLTNAYETVVGLEDEDSRDGSSQRVPVRPAKIRGDMGLSTLNPTLVSHPGSE
jgi:hypothetical protein